MKHKIPLTPHNIKILTEQYQIPAEQLTCEYWINHIMTNSDVLLPLLDNRFGSKDPQKKIKNRASRLVKKTIRTAVGLPGPSGNQQKQKVYLKILKQAGLEQ